MKSGDIDLIGVNVSWRQIMMGLDLVINISNSDVLLLNPLMFHWIAKDVLLC